MYAHTYLLPILKVSNVTDVSIIQNLDANQSNFCASTSLLIAVSHCVILKAVQKSGVTSTNEFLMLVLVEVFTVYQSPVWRHTTHKVGVCTTLKRSMKTINGTKK